jgi:hypothetical protein
MALQSTPGTLLLAAAAAAAAVAAVLALVSFSSSSSLWAGFCEIRHKGEAKWARVSSAVVSGS